MERLEGWLRQAVNLRASLSIQRGKGCCSSFSSCIPHQGRILTSSADTCRGITSLEGPVSGSILVVTLGAVIRLATVPKGGARVSLEKPSSSSP